MPSPLPTAFYYLLILAGGVAVAIQQVLNARLRVDLGSPWWAGFVSYLVGLVAMVVILVITGDPAPAAPFARGSSYLTWAGGVFGAIFICVTVLTVPRFGAATVLALIVVGQMVGTLIFDHFGVLGMPQHPVGVLRIAGAACLILGVALIRA